MSTPQCWGQYDRLLGVAAVGAEKTVVAAALIQARLPEGPALFVAHNNELICQALDKLRRAAGIVAARKQAGSHGRLSDPVVVASVQTLHAARLERWPPKRFKTTIIDECHRSAATTYRRVLEHSTKFWASRQRRTAAINVRLACCETQASSGVEYQRTSCDSFNFLSNATSSYRRSFRTYCLCRSRYFFQALRSSFVLPEAEPIF